MSDGVPAWASLALPAVGYVAAVSTEWLRDRRAARHEAERERRATHAQDRGRREAFELDTLTELYGALMDLARKTSAWHTSRADGDESPDQTEAFRLASVNASRLADLILDDPLRSLVLDAIVAQYKPLIEASTAAEIKKVAMQAILQIQPAQQAIAARIRAIYTTRPVT